MDDHPIRLVVEDDLRRSRLTVFFRLLLALPHFVWLFLWSIAALLAAVANWVATLVAGTPPAGLHGFLSRYLRYGTHVTAYVALTANPYPGFTGEPGYAVDLQLPEPARQSRWKTLFRLPLALPALMLAAVLSGGSSGGGGSGWESDSGTEAAFGVSGVAAVCAFLGWFASLARGRMPNGLRDLAAYGVGYAAQAYGYALLLTDRYPSSDPEAIGPRWSLPPHRVWLLVTDDGRRSRLTVFFRGLLALPHLVWLVLWGIAAWLAAIANGIAALVTGRAPDPLRRFIGAYIRYAAHVLAFLFLAANPFPGFVGAPGYPVDVDLGPNERQSRWVTLFRIVLAVPALLVSGALSGALLLAGFLGWFAALATGRMPTGLRNLAAVAIRYGAQTNAYLLIVTDAYPYSSPGLPARAPAEQPVL